MKKKYIWIIIAIVAIAGFNLNKSHNLHQLEIDLEGSLNEEKFDLDLSKLAVGLSNFNGNRIKITKDQKKCAENAKIIDEEFNKVKFLKNPELTDLILATIKTSLTCGESRAIEYKIGMMFRRLENNIK